MLCGSSTCLQLVAICLTTTLEQAAGRTSAHGVCPPYPIIIFKEVHMPTRRHMLKLMGSATLLPALPAIVSAQARLTPLVTNIRAAHRADVQPQFDRVVVDMVGPPPPEVWWQYVAKLIAGGSGLEVPIAGSHRYQISLRGAHAHDEDGRSTLVRREITPRLPVVQQVKVFSDFEGIVLIGIGLSRETRTRTLLLYDSVGQTTRAVVDFMV
jgi:hypothetical protein